MSALTHDQAQAYLHAPELTPAERVALDEHLAGCADCRAYAETLAKLGPLYGRALHSQWDARVSRAPTSVNLNRILNAPKPNRLFDSLSAALGMAALALIVIALGWIVWRQSQLPTQNPTPSVTPSLTVSPAPTETLDCPNTFPAPAGCPTLTAAPTHTPPPVLLTPETTLTRAPAPGSFSTLPATFTPCQIGCEGLTPSPIADTPQPASTELPCTDCVPPDTATPEPLLTPTETFTPTLTPVPPGTSTPLPYPLPTNTSGGYPLPTDTPNGYPFPSDSPTPEATLTPSPTETPTP